MGLAIEGGGMRGVISGAMLTALEDLHLRDAFDAVYGCSSGAMNAAYFLVGESWFPLSIYYDDLPTKSFLDFRRFLLGRSMLNVDFAFDVVAEKVKPLDYAAVLASAVPLHVMVTLVDRLETVHPFEFESREDLKSALRASAWLPIATTGTALFRGERAIDGGALIGHPFRIALDDGCSHVLSLSTRPMGLPPRRRPSFLQSFATAWLERMKPGLGTRYAAGVRTYARERVNLERARTSPSADFCVLDLAPLPGTPEVKRHEMDRWVLLESARRAYEVLVLALERRRVRAIPRLTTRERERGPAPLT